MGEMMFTAAIQALELIFDPTRMAFLVFGVLLGLVIGVAPGIGGLAGLSLLLPFTFDMDPYTALAMMMGLLAVGATADAIPAVLFGVPGGIGSAATILDGFPMARKGEAGRAFGATFTSSVMGGLFGAALLALSIPILRPLMLIIGSPEMLSICIFGLSLAAVLSGSTPLKGLAGACLGLLIATTGDDPQTGTLRWTFGTLYLWDGLPIVPMALGLFAIPEIADMAIARQSITSKGFRTSGMQQLEGVKDSFKHWFLILRCSWIGAALGAVPGIGAAIIDWVAYGHAARTEKGAAGSFGKGDVRGVLASESSNNAKEGGSLVPTIAFGVPGSASMALILGAFLIHGLVPGPDMLTKRLDITYTLVWSVAIANIVGAGICFLFANQLAKIALVRIGILAPLVISITFVSAYQGSSSWGDIYALLLFGALGWIMKRLKWPRPPLILGFVLGKLVERYMFISVERYGADFLLHPVVFAMLALTLWGILSPIVRNYRRNRKLGRPKTTIAFRSAGLNTDTLFTVLLFAIFAAALIVSARWEFGAKLVPQVVGWTGLLFVACLMFSNLFLSRAARPIPMEQQAMAAAQPAGSEIHFDIQAEYGDLSRKEITQRAFVFFGWCLFYLAIAALMGLLPATLIFLVVYMWIEGKEKWKVNLITAVTTVVCSYLVFHSLLHVAWPQALVGELFPELRSIQSLNLF
jgi:TctA family transporter